MSRQSSNQTVNGIIKNGYSYAKQCWIENGIIENCGHPETMDCRCYGRLHHGEQSTLTE